MRYEELGEPAPWVSLAQLVTALTRGKVSGRRCAHLDPDLRPDLRAARSQNRNRNELLLFGQCDRTQTELREVGTGDLFLFFGWFREAERHGRAFRFVPGAPDEHHLWGWLQVGHVHHVPDLKHAQALDRRMRHHPHVAYADRWTNNYVYEAAERLSFAPEIPGAGLFRTPAEKTRLTDRHATSRSRWRLPAFFADAGMTRFTFDPSLWKRERGTVVSIAPRAKGCGAASYGQEFVTRTAGVRKEAQRWLRELFATGM